jgi:hypothetical protein
MRGAIQELFGKVSSIRSRAAQSERMVDEICRDIKVCVRVCECV